MILPLLKPSLQVALILRTILALAGLCGGDCPLSGGDVVTVLANETYRQYYDLRNINVAAAYAGLILLLSMISAVILSAHGAHARGGERMTTSQRSTPLQLSRSPPRCSGCAHAPGAGCCSAAA